MSVRWASPHGPGRYQAHIYAEKYHFVRTIISQNFLFSAQMISISLLSHSSRHQTQRSQTRHAHKTFYSNKQKIKGSFDGGESLQKFWAMASFICYLWALLCSFSQNVNGGWRALYAWDENVYWKVQKMKTYINTRMCGCWNISSREKFPFSKRSDSSVFLSSWRSIRQARSGAALY